jgi:hypothetical protein
MCCTNRFQRLRSHIYPFEYVYDNREYKNIRESAQNGCQICSLVSAGVIAIFGKAKDDLKIQTGIAVGVDKLQYTRL